MLLDSFATDELSLRHNEWPSYNRYIIRAKPGRV